MGVGAPQLLNKEVEEGSTKQVCGRDRRRETSQTDPVNRNCTFSWSFDTNKVIQEFLSLIRCLFLYCQTLIKLQEPVDSLRSEYINEKHVAHQTFRSYFVGGFGNRKITPRGRLQIWEIIYRLKWLNQTLNQDVTLHVWSCFFQWSQYITFWS